jgi:thioredoxin reductase/Pyruvate/2-oxoacid:ferredoxin oxidoreductase delta subunit
VSFGLLVGVALVLGVTLLLTAARRVELERMARGLEERAEARRRGSDRARLQVPHVDLTRCLGCGTCVAACPEEGVLDMLHGQAVVVHGARCVGHGNCARECPTGAIVVTLADLESRNDMPALTSSFEAVGSPGLFLAGEVTGYALVRTAVEQGTAVADEVAGRVRAANGSARADDAHDLIVVGAGPAGLACSLRAKEHALDFVAIERESLGGTVASYPRRKLVMTQPVDLPLVGRLGRKTYEKEELIAIWEEAARAQTLPIRTGVRLSEVAAREDGTFAVRTDGGELRARNVCLALGRRGSPRKLGVPGEDLPKVAYSLIDAQAYAGRRILVVGGGDSAIEAALGLSAEGRNEVTLSYRKQSFTRLKARNEARLDEALAAGRIRLVTNSHVRAILETRVDLVVEDGDGERELALPNDEVFVFAGGVPPFPLLEAAGVSFDPHDRPKPVPLAEQGTGLVPALAAAFVVALAALAFGTWHADYYALPAALRPDHLLHDALRPAGSVGLVFGLVAAAAVTLNLAYLLRRSPRLRLTLGSLRAWMTSHVVTGVLALLLAVLHAAFDPRVTVGGFALLALVVLVGTGSVGRYLYSFVPRAANGRELELEEIRSRLTTLSTELGRSHRGFTEHVEQEVARLVAGGHWSGSLPRRLRALLGSRAQLRRALSRLRVKARAADLPPGQTSEILALLRELHRAALTAAHYEDLRGLLASWRWLHRWVALLMVLLVAAHVLTALRYGDILGGGR